MSRLHLPQRLRASARSGRFEGLGRAGLHLAALWAFALVGPLLDLLGRSPAFFVARGNTRGDILVLAFGLALGPPLAMLAVEGVASLVSKRVREGVHLLFIGLLVLVIMLGFLRRIGGVGSVVLIPVAAVVGGLATLAYVRRREVRGLVSLLGFAPLLFVGVFLLVSPTSKLVLPSKAVTASSAKIPGRTPVVVIVFDELSALQLLDGHDRIDARRFPNFAWLSRHANWYRNATTVTDFTERAVPAFLTGQRPEPGAAPIAADHPDSLFTFLGGHYRLDVTEPVTDVCPEQLCPGQSADRPSTRVRLRSLAKDLAIVSGHLVLPNDLANRLPAINRSFGDFAALGNNNGAAADGAAGAGARAFAALSAIVDRVGSFTRFVQRLHPYPGRPTLSFLHVEMPHNPYYFLPSGQRYPETQTGLRGLGDTGPPGGIWGKDRWLVHQANQRYLLQLGFTDRLLGHAIARMRATGLWNRAAFVVVADHGASFRSGSPHRAATATNFPDIATIPLFVKAPGQRASRTVDGNVSIIDALPTLAARLGTKLPWPVDGHDADRAGSGGTVTLDPVSGGHLTEPFTTFVRRRNERVAQILREFRPDQPDGVYRAVPDAALLGRRAAPLASAGFTPLRFDLDLGGLLASVDRKGAVLPSFLTGRITGGAAPAQLALAVNGRIATVTEPYSDGGVERFSALIPPRVLRQGPNQVEAFAVSGVGGALRLTRLSGGGAVFTLVHGAGGEHLRDGAGHTVPVAPGVQGSVESQEIGPAEVRLKGWAGVVASGHPAAYVVAFAGDRLLAVGRPSTPRPDLAKRLGPGLGHAGWELSGWATGPRPGTRAAPIRVFAVAGGRATELPVAKLPKL